jgi:WD repeat-containing protein 68
MSKDVFLSVGADGSLRAFDLRALEHSTILYETPASGPSSPPMASGAGQSRHQASDSTTSTSAPNKPLARISFSQKEQHYLAIFGFGDTAASILDMRNPGVPVAELVGHQKGLSAVGWGCESRASHGGGGWVATCGKSELCKSRPNPDPIFLGDDSQLLLYDLTSSLPYPASAVSSTNSSPAPMLNAKRGSDASSSGTTSRASDKPAKHSETLAAPGVVAAKPTVKKQPYMAWTADNGEVNNLAWGRDGDEGAWLGAVSGKRLTCLRF